MLEMKITITAPDLAAAINNLAEAYAKNSRNPLETATNALKDVAEKTMADRPVTHPQGAQTPQTTASPVTTAPIANPAHEASTRFVNSMQAQVPVTAPAVQPYSQTPPAQAFQAAPAANPVPVAAPQYTLEMLATAGSSLIDAGKMDQLMALLGGHGVDSLTNLKPEEYGVVATELRAMGARI